MGKLWSKGYELDALIESFTVGEDYLLDRRLVIADCAGSIAHSIMLGDVGLLSADEVSRIVAELRRIAKESVSNSFTVTREDEDGHTAIENELVATLGDVGKKVHTGRSRNDQVLLALRLFEREFLLSVERDLCELIEQLLGFARAHASIPMVGRTHMQPAMPSSVGLWAAAWAEELLVDGGLLSHAFIPVNRSPLGSAAGYGTSLPLNRERVAELLAFDGVVTNVLWASNSRGKLESIIVDALDQLGLTLSKMAQDLILFSLPEFGYFSLPDELCTGSSIMPQKRNPDGLELVRAKSATLSAYATQIRNVIRSLPSGYNRDFQETKGPLFRAMDTAIASIRVMLLTVKRTTVNGDRLRAAFTPDVFATDAAYELVETGVPFRDAYRAVAASLGELKDHDPDAAIDRRTATGTPGNLGLDAAQSELASRRAAVEERAKAVSAATRSVLGAELPIFS